ncbi:PPE family protein [Mycobacterium sp.]|uniref:PPE family protein n=1 Tax=Mycobacterium sp. TaxID=1785 RepID=UPI0026165999|nr:PPE family protein [Mycobacterium sp.]
MFVDFATLAPEINSARMYAGPGSGPMLAAASAWNGLSAELRSAALSYGSVLSALTSEEWHGPAAAAMAAAAMPYVAWMNTTAAQAEQAATQAEAAAAAYEAAFAATVPPPMIAANRAQLATLIATNVLGQNTAAIAATEAQYGEMWAQDAAAMYGYAGSSAGATRLAMFTEPKQTTRQDGVARQAAAVSQATGTSAGSQQATWSQLNSAVPNALQTLSSPTTSPTTSPTSSTSGLSSILDPNSNFWNTLTSSGAFNPAQVVQTVTSSTLIGSSASALNDLADAVPVATGVATGTQGLSGLAGVGNAGASVSAGLGRASLVGPLSVPPSWAPPAPVTGPLAPTPGGTPMVAPPPAMAAGMPGMPFGGVGGQGFGRAVPQYGFRPNFVVRPPAAG